MADNGIEVLVLLDVSGLEDVEKFEKHVKRGIYSAEGEKHVYTGHLKLQLFLQNIFGSFVRVYKIRFFRCKFWFFIKWDTISSFTTMIKKQMILNWYKR